MNFPASSGRTSWTAVAAPVLDCDHGQTRGYGIELEMTRTLSRKTHVVGMMFDPTPRPRRRLFLLYPSRMCWEFRKRGRKDVSFLMSINNPEIGSANAPAKTSTRGPAPQIFPISSAPSSRVPTFPKLTVVIIPHSIPNALLIIFARGARQFVCVFPREISTPARPSEKRHQERKRHERCSWHWR